MNLPTTSDGSVTLWWETPHAPGAVAIGRLASASVASLDALLSQLTGSQALAVGEMSHRPFAMIDDGLVVRLASDQALIMPHGGVRIVAQLDKWMRAHGVADARVDPRGTYPEARCEREALALEAASTAASARAIPLLLAQPARIAAAASNGWTHDVKSQARAQRLARLLHPPRVVAVGAANVGKSSLLNAVAGRTVSIAMDFAGTTRDCVAARVELDGLVVDWFDTPGIRVTDDEVERAAQAIATSLRASADLILEISAPAIPCPNQSTITERLSVCTRIDLDRDHRSPEASAASVHVSAHDRTGIPQLARAIRASLVSDDDLSSTEPWIFRDGLLCGLTAP